MGKCPFCGGNEESLCCDRGNDLHLAMLYREGARHQLVKAQAAAARAAERIAKYTQEIETLRKEAENKK